MIAARAHLEDEVRPFLRGYDESIETCDELESIYSRIYQSPLGHEIGDDGKIKL